MGPAIGSRQEISAYWDKRIIKRGVELTKGSFSEQFQLIPPFCFFGFFNLRTVGLVSGPDNQNIDFPKLIDNTD